MTAATAILGGLVAGYFIRDRRSAYLIWAAVWVVVLAAQTTLLATTEDSVDWAYVPVQIVIFACGVLAVWIGTYLRHRRNTRSVQDAETAP